MKNIILKLSYLYYAVLSETVGLLVNLLFPAGKTAESRKKLLLVRLDSIGDFILFLDSFSGYRKLYPPDGWEITLIGNRAWSELAKITNYADRYIFLDVNSFYRNLFYKWRILRQIREEGFDVAIQSAYSRTFEIADAIIRAAGAREKIGSEGNLSNISPLRKMRANRFYTKLIATSEEDMPEIERNAEFIKGLGLKDFKASCPKLDIPASKINEIMEKFRLPKNYYILFPCAGSPIKQWPVERFAKLGDFIYSKIGLTGVVCCGSSAFDFDTSKALCDSSSSPLINLAAKTTLYQLACVIANAKFLIGNDTGAVHISAATGTPTICIMGGGHYERFFPYGDISDNISVTHPMDCFKCNWQCIYPTCPEGAAKCIENISFETVAESVEGLFKKLRTPS